MSKLRPPGCGRVTPIAVRSTIKSALDEARLRLRLLGLRILRRDQLARRLAVIRSAYWIVLSRSQVKRLLPAREGLRAQAQLLFLGAFDGADEDSLNLLAGLPEFARTLDAIWGRCLGFDGSSQLGVLCDFVRDNQFEASSSLDVEGAWGEASVKDVRGALALSLALDQFALESSQLSDLQFKRAYEQLLCQVGSDLAA
jgi:hypothetical protein